MVSFGIYLPNVGWEVVPRPSELVDYAIAAEDMGINSVWVEDRLLHPRLGILEAVTTLTFVASRTKRVQLGTSVLLVNLRNPLVLAKALSTLDYLSNGRLIVGASLGGRPHEYGAAGITMKTRVSRFVETINAMKAFWGQGSVDEASHHFQLTDLSMQPRPHQRRIPILIGGQADRVLRRVATLGDGWLASSYTSSQDFVAGWQRIREHALSLGRDPTTLIPAKFVYIQIDDHQQQALEMLEERLPRYYDFPYDVARLAIYGPPARCIQQASELLKAGVETLIFSPVTSDKTQLERLARQVLPKLAK